MGNIKDLDSTALYAYTTLVRAWPCMHLLQPCVHSMRERQQKCVRPAV